MSIGSIEKRWYFGREHHDGGDDESITLTVQADDDADDGSDYSDDSDEDKDTKDDSDDSSGYDSDDSDDSDKSDDDCPKR